MKVPNQNNLSEKIIALASVKCVELDLKMLHNLEKREILLNKEVAGIFLVTPRALDRWRVFRKLGHKKISNRYRYTWTDIFEYLKSLE